MYGQGRLEPGRAMRDELEKGREEKKGRRETGWSGMHSGEPDDGGVWLWEIPRPVVRGRALDDRRAEGIGQVLQATRSQKQAWRGGHCDAAQMPPEAQSSPSRPYRAQVSGLPPA